MLPDSRLASGGLPPPAGPHGTLGLRLSCGPASSLGAPSTTQGQRPVSWASSRDLLGGALVLFFLCSFDWSRGLFLGKAGKFSVRSECSFVTSVQWGRRQTPGAAGVSFPHVQDAEAPGPRPPRALPDVALGADS